MRQFVTQLDTEKVHSKNMTDVSFGEVGDKNQCEIFKPLKKIKGRRKPNSSNRQRRTFLSFSFVAVSLIASRVAGSTHRRASEAEIPPNGVETSSSSSRFKTSYDYEGRFAITSLREHDDEDFCATTTATDATNGAALLHRVEKRSYLPPVQCTLFHETNAVRSKVHCRPRPRVVRLPFPNDTSVNQMTPSHIEVNRCDGSCFHRKQSCLPIRTKQKIVPVLLAKCTIHSNKCDKTCAQIEISEHVQCGCECKIKRHHCNIKQVYREELCGCQCRDLSEVRACHESGRVWDPSKCMCRCPLSTLQECSTKFVFDFTNSCKCIPEENNEIPGERTERSQPGSGPRWEVLTIVGMSVGILLLVLLAISLVRHIQRLKMRLRRSAEVLVPSGARVASL